MGSTESDFAFAMRMIDHVGNALKGVSVDVNVDVVVLLVVSEVGSFVRCSILVAS